MTDWLLGNRTNRLALCIGLLPLRAMIGVIMAAHGAQKAFGALGGRGFPPTVEMVRNLGFPVPDAFAVLLVLAELVGGLMLIVGLAPRLAAAANAVVIAVALLTVHRADGFFQTHVQQMILAGCLTVLIAGAGLPAAQRTGPRTAQPDVPSAQDEGAQ
jgi:putative oxidoreductase